MPHKRAKRSEREKNRLQSGNDFAPGAQNDLEHEGIPKSAARVLNAARVQQDWAEKKRKAAEEHDAVARKKRRKGGDDEEKNAGRSVQLRIMHGESMAHFNRRVEDCMRQSVRHAIQASSAHERHARKEHLATKNSPAVKADVGSRKARVHTSTESDGDPEEISPTRGKDTGQQKDFERLSTSAPKRLNDIVQAPPNLTKLPRKAKQLAGQGTSLTNSRTNSLREGVLSMAQKVSLEEERERVIRLYREMKRVKAS